MVPRHLNAMAVTMTLKSRCSGGRQSLDHPLQESFGGGLQVFLHVGCARCRRKSCGTSPQLLPKRRQVLHPIPSKMVRLGPKT